MSRIVLLAEVAQGHREHLGEEKQPQSVEEEGLSFLLADDEIAASLVSFDERRGLLLQWCAARSRNTEKTDTDGWRENAIVLAAEVSSRASHVISLQRKQLGFGEWDGLSDLLEIPIPTLKV